MLKNKSTIHPIIKRLYAFAVCTLLALIGIVGGGVLKPALGATDIGANPTPKVDIAVSVPSDYSGTFLDFKEELTQKLIAEGMDPSSFRITNTAVSIDTSDLDGWYVYDHYRDATAYNNLGLSAEQKAKQPNRTTVDSHVSGSKAISEILDRKTNRFTVSACPSLDRHIYTYQTTNEYGNTVSNMAFAGYGTNAYADWMIYPATSSSTRTFSFNLDASVINSHTLNSFGFFMNSAVIDGKVYGYLLNFNGASAAGGKGDMNIYKVNGIAADSLSTTFLSSPISSNYMASISMGTQKKIRLTVTLKSDSLTVQTQQMDANGNLSDLQTPLKEVAIPQFYSGETLNGFGPWVGYSSHSCTGFSGIVYTDLEMTYEASAFDALKTTQYYQGAEQKYFINVVGDSGDPNIPEEKTPTGTVNENYTDGINRMNENEIFYISNAQDGKIVTDSAADGSHQGLGAKNGYIATDDDYVTQIAQYIYKNHVEGVKFTQAPIASEIPLANFYLINKADGSQLMTVHQKHLADGESCYVNIFDKSMVGTLAGKDGTIEQWRLRVYDPNNKTAYDSGWKTDKSQIADYAITNKSVAGQYHFELTVKDQLGHESKATQTYLTVFLDEHFPNITAENSARNVATIKLVDTGQGIDEDGITFIEDNRGSGVAAYWITNDPNATPSEDDWETITPQHEYSIRHDLDSTEPVVVWVRDECGNVGNKAVFQPTRVLVQDVDGNPIEDYIVIDEKPIIVLPDEDDLDDPKDEDDKFAGWVTDTGTPVTPGTDVPKNDDHTIVIRPSYAKDYANLYYLANGGTIPGSSHGVYTTFQVVSGNSIKAKIDAQNVKPEREGYSFDGWKLVKGDTNTEVNGLVDLTTGVSTASAAQLEDPDNKTADLVLLDPEGNPRDEANIKKSNYYLVAQWKVGNYKVNLDANGGSLGNVRGFEDVAFGANVDSLSFPQSGRGIPSKPGYIFQGWSKTKHEATPTWTAPNDVIRVANGASGITQTTYGTMPAHDVTVYAVWKYDTSKFIVSFDSAGGSSVKDIAYQTSTASKYTDDGFKTPSRAGYDFDGWYLVDDEGNAGDTRYNGTESINANLKKDHTFRAKWIPRNDTPYSIEYMVNTGRKDANGNAIYTKANSVDRIGTTEQDVSVAESEKTPEITVDGVTYWYNPDSSRSVTDAEGTVTQVNNNVLEGKISGNPTLAMRLYYDRYLDVNVSKKGTGEGTVSSALDQKEGTTPTVTWSASNGSHVSKVTVDGIVRDDLISAGQYTVEGSLINDVNVVVEFTKDDPTIEDGPSDQGDRKAYTVLTEIHGCTNDRDGCTITPTQPYKAGSDVAISWDVCRNCKLLRVEVDGEPVDVSGNTFNFKGLAADHKVAVYLSTTSMPTIGGSETDGHYTITVNRYGGDEKYFTSKSCTIPYAEKDTSDKWEFEWRRQDSKYKIYEIRVDGKKVRGGIKADGEFSNVKDTNSYNLAKGANHVVDVYFFEEPADEEGNEPDPVIPDFSNPEEWVSVSTQVVGGAGEIDPGFVAKKSDDADATHTVTYNLENKDNYDDADYTYYEVVNVEVDGDKNAVIEQDEGKVTVTLKEDSKVTVYVEPVTKEVETLAVTYNKDGETTQAPTAGGTIAASRTVGLYGNYNNIQATAKTGYRIGAIEVTDQRELDNAPAGEEKANVVTYLFLSSGMEKTTKPVKGSQIVGQNDLKKEAPQAEVINPQALSANQDAEAVPSSDPRSKVQEPASESADKNNPDKEISGSSAATTDTSGDETAGAPEAILMDEASVVTGEDSLDKEDTDPLKMMANSLDSALFTKAYADGTNGANADPNVFSQPTISGSTASLNITNITEDQKVIVHFVPNDTSDDEIKKSVEDRQEDKLHQVTVQFVDENGNQLAVAPQSEGMGYVKDGANATISWGALSGYTVSKVNGNEVEASTTSYTVNNVTEDKIVLVTLKKDEATDKPAPPIQPSGFENKYVVTTKVTGYGACEISPTKSFAPGSSYKVTWKVIDSGTAAAQADGEDVAPTVPLNVPYIIAVTIDGKPATKEQAAELGDIFKEDDTKVSDTKSGTRTFSNINENHDVEVTTVLMNEDEDGDGKPDNNVDTDGDGKPDINKDTDGDGKPDADVDTDDDGEPDVNKDTDGDGKPDVNIVDEDGDGKPDPVDPKDPDGPKKPNVNVDTDDDGEPDVNKDTDGDGKPDVNIVDEDGDGKPDPVDPKDPDGPKPNVNVDPDGDDIPDINVDTDGDGKPDVNKDTDGDGEPDVNIVDTDGDGKPDPVDPKDPDSPKVPTTNVDTDDDGKPDVNVDTDGDGKPDVNIVDTDGDGEPDPVDPKDPDSPKVPTTNVDTDGDGKPDLNIDKDGDGKPDINIVDKDGDGKPDPVDPKSDPLPEPNVNVDIDGDGWPDINIDTDGDGKPDKNVDTNDDGVYDWKDEEHPQHQAYLDSLRDTNNDGVYDWKDESHPDHQAYLDSLKAKVTPAGSRVAPKMGDASIVSSLAGLLAAAVATTGGIAFVGRKRRNRK